MKAPACVAFLLALQPTAIRANTEKVIFTAPDPVRLPDTKPGVGLLQLTSLSHQQSTLPASLVVAFPSEERLHGVDHWYILKHLHQRQRYELRVCWSATQPTSFVLNIYSISHVFDTPQLIQSLANAVNTPDTRAAHTGPLTGVGAPADLHESVLFLHIQAAADFYSSNQTLMLNPPNVDVDIILDPYVAGVFPESLIPTAGYLVLLAIGSWFLSSLIWQALKPTARTKDHSD